MNTNILQSFCTVSGKFIDFISEGWSIKPWIPQIVSSDNRSGDIIV